MAKFKTYYGFADKLNYTKLSQSPVAFATTTQQYCNDEFKKKSTWIGNLGPTPFVTEEQYVTSLKKLHDNGNRIETSVNKLRDEVVIQVLIHDKKR